MKIERKTNSQVRTEKEKLVMENFTSVMGKLDATFLAESNEYKVKEKCKVDKVQSIKAVSKLLYDVKRFVDGWKSSKIDNIDPYEHNSDNLKMFQNSVNHFKITDDMKPTYENALRAFTRNGVGGMGIFIDQNSCAWEQEKYANEILSEIGLTLREVLSIQGVK